MPRKTGGGGESCKDSASGNHSAGLANFGATADHKSCSTPKFAKNYESNTAIPRILEENKQAGRENPYREQASLESTFEKSSDFSSTILESQSGKKNKHKLPNPTASDSTLESTFTHNTPSLRDTAPAVAWQSVASLENKRSGASVAQQVSLESTSNNNLESTFTHNLDSSSKLRSLESPPSDTNQNRQPSNKSPNTTNYIGFYVDIGAHHPFRFSNTYALYKAGWSGINIDPMPKSMEKFRRFRPRDINLEIAIGASQDIKPYYIFEEKALNTFDESLARDYARSSRLVDVISIPCYPINAILARYASAPIDLLSIDVEGQDMAILSTLDFAVYAPRVVLAESFSQDLMRDPLVSFMRTKGYNLLAKTTRTCIFVRARI